MRDGPRDYETRCHGRSHHRAEGGTHSVGDPQQQASSMSEFAYHIFKQTNPPPPPLSCQALGKCARSQDLDVDEAVRRALSGESPGQNPPPLRESGSVSNGGSRGGSDSRGDQGGGGGGDAGEAKAEEKGQGGGGGRGGGSRRGSVEEGVEGRRASASSGGADEKVRAEAVGRSGCRCAHGVAGCSGLVCVDALWLTGGQDTCGVVRSRLVLATGVFRERQPQCGQRRLAAQLQHGMVSVCTHGLSQSSRRGLVADWTLPWSPLLL